jgi:alanyl-tRNA synthetase
VQRRIVRRAIRHGYKLGQKTPFFHKLVPDLVRMMGEAYPNMASQAQRITDILKAEEERFYETLATGMEILDRVISQGQPTLTRHKQLGTAFEELQSGRVIAYTEIDSERWVQSATLVCQDVPSSELLEVLRNHVGDPNTALHVFLRVGQSGEPVFVLPGNVAFKLHATYGFPLDLTQDVCRERNVIVDVDGFNVEMEKDKAQARAAGKFKMDKALEYSGAGNTFVGYEQLQQTAKVLAVYVDGASVEAIKHGQNGVVVLDTTPFYAESGGQVGDQGVITSGSASFEVGDTLKIKADVFGHHGTLTQGTLAVGDTVNAQVNTAARAATVRNHSATHLMHKALREVLGEHVQQKGSLVDAEKTRFDFVHNAPMTDAQIREVERRVNDEILANAAAQARVMDIESAKQTGAMMLFGEKYGDTVRVLDIGSSRELCGGVHVQRTGDIGVFTITAEGGVAAGVRRVEAVTGLNALAYMQGMETMLGGVAGTLKVTPAEVHARVDGLLGQVRDLEKELAALKGKLASAQGDELLTQAVDVKGIKVLAAVLQGADAKVLRDTMDKLKDKLKTAAIVLAAVDGDKVQLAAGVTADSTGKVKAGELVNFVAQQVGGKGGGKPDMAMAGGTNAAALPQALAGVVAWVSERV